jgi:hypothetical protein
VGVVALQIGWFRTVLRCGASSDVTTLAERFSLDRPDSQIERFIDFGSYYTTIEINAIHDLNVDRHDTQDRTHDRKVFLHGMGATHRESTA